MDAKQPRQIGLKVFFAITMLIGMYFAYRDYQGKQPSPIPDKVLFLNFYKQILGKAAVADKTFTPFDDARTKGNQLKAAKIALDIKYEMEALNNDMHNVEMPKLQNQKAAADLIKMRDYIEGCYIYKQMMVDDYLSALKDQNPVSIAKFQNDAEKSQSYMFAALSETLDICKDLGMTDAETKKMTEATSLSTTTP